jgi:hypothetical protein
MSRTRETAARLDTAIDGLLRGSTAPADTEEGELLATARLLRDVLPRLHPRFGFEEHLAARLAAARLLAGGPDRDMARPGAAEPTPLRPGLTLPPSNDPDVAPAAVPGAAPSPAEHRRQRLVAGSAIASGVSLAGAAFVVWRRNRSSGGLF